MRDRNGSRLTRITPELDCLPLFSAIAKSIVEEKGGEGGACIRGRQSRRARCLLRSIDRALQRFRESFETDPAKISKTLDLQNTKVQVHRELAPLSVSEGRHGPMDDPKYDGSGRGTKYERMNQAQKVVALNSLITQWREPGFVRVKPARVIPDTTNREGTGVSAMHVHYIAVSMQQEGFTPRDHATGKGHDLPILVRETAGKASPLGAESLAKWREAQASNPEYPPAQPWMGKSGETFFCSLGNGHFFQSLNLFGAEHPCKFADSVELPHGDRYSTVSDAKLADAVEVGVPAVVLKTGMPKRDRKFVSLMLNSTFEYPWVTDADGSVRIDTNQEFREFTTFDGMTKHADSYQLDEIVELKLRRESQKRKAAALEAKRLRAIAERSRAEREGGRPTNRRRLRSRI